MKVLFYTLCFWVFAKCPDFTSSLDIHTSPQAFCYDHEDCGPSSSFWNGTCVTGHHQSPIDLTGDIIHPTVIEIPLTHFVADHFFMQNNGHTLNIDLAAENEDHNSYFFPGFGISPTKYRLSNIHFHWGHGDHNGSEHAVKGKKFTMEVHFVHYNENYNTPADAIRSGNPFALAVVAIFLQSHHFTRPSAALRPIISNLEKVKDVRVYWYKVDEVLNLTSLVPRTGDLLYSYRGSLTTPGCNEQVSWFVFREPVPISHEDVRIFRGLKDGEGKRLSANFRPLQSRHRRVVRLHSVVRGHSNVCRGSGNAINNIFDIEL